MLATFPRRTVCILFLAIAAGTTHAAKLVAVPWGIAGTDTEWTYGQSTFDASGLQTYRIFICELDDEADILAVGGSFDCPSTVAAGGFFNTPLEPSPRCPDPALHQGVPETQWDTCVTLNGSPNLGISPAFPDWPLGNGGADTFADPFGTWFNSQPNQPVHPVDGRVFIAQVTFEEGQALTFEVLAQIRESDNDIRLECFTLDLDAVCELNCPGDADGDGWIDIDDLLLLIGCLGDNCQDTALDFNQDGTVDVLDLLVLLTEWGPCGGPVHPGV